MFSLEEVVGKAKHFSLAPINSISRGALEPAPKSLEKVIIEGRPWVVKLKESLNFQPLMRCHC